MIWWCLKIFNVSNSIDKFYLNNLTNNDKLKDNYQSEIKLSHIDNHIIPVLKKLILIILKMN